MSENLVCGIKTKPKFQKEKKRKKTKEGNLSFDLRTSPSKKARSTIELISPAKKHAWLIINSQVVKIYFYNFRLTKKDIESRAQKYVTSTQN